MILYAQFLADSLLIIYQMPLIVKPISAMLTTDKDFLGKSDPYCILFVGNEKQQTRTCSGGGKNPIWQDTLSFNTQGPELRVQVWDDDTFSDDMIGQGKVNLNQCYSRPNATENEYVDLVHRGKSVGRVLISLEYQGPPMGGGYGYPPQQGGYPQQGGWGGQQQGGWGQQQGQWGGQQGGWGGQQQGGWGQGGQQGGWGQGGQQGGWGGNQQGGWGGGQQGGWGGNQGGRGGW